MTQPLEPPDSHYLDAADGWLKLGDHLEANKELERITPINRVHPDVLQLRWRIYAKAKNWEACLDIATTLIRNSPDRRFGWLHLAVSLHRLRRTQEAFDFLQEASARFDQNATIPYYLACFSSQLGKLDEARQWLKKAFDQAADKQQKQRLKLRALEEPDLEPIWKDIST